MWPFWWIVFIEYKARCINGFSVFSEYEHESPHSKLLSESPKKLFVSFSYNSTDQSILKKRSVQYSIGQIVEVIEKSKSDLRKDHDVMYYDKSILNRSQKSVFNIFPFQNQGTLRANLQNFHHFMRKIMDQKEFYLERRDF